MRILAIETSCDETAISILECSGDLSAPAFSLLGTGLFSQAHLHEKYGGVYPNLARREHEKNIIPLLEVALKEAGGLKIEDGKEINLDSVFPTLESILIREQILTPQFKEFLTKNPHIPDVDAIAITQGPGLEPALWVGVNFAKALSYVWQKPLIPVNHMEGHIFSVLIHEKEMTNDKPQISNKISFPAIALLVSGGHTELQLVNDWLSYTRLGETRDDAVGEAFDKVARLIGLPYPGGPEISRLAGEARKNPSADISIKLPRPMIKSDDYDFSFAGLKTAVLYMTRDHGEMSDAYKRELAREFEDAAVDVLCAKTKKALDEFDATTLIVGGGVIGNKYLRECLASLLSEEFPNVQLCMPTRDLSTDNAVMIGIAGYLRYEKTPTEYSIFSPDQTLKASGTLRL